VAFKVGLLGLGTVGVGTVQILQDPAQRHPLLQELEIHKVGVRNLDKARSVTLPADCLTSDLASIVTDPAIDIVIEVLGGLEPARSLILQAISHGKHVVTANKAVISRFGAEIFAAAAAAGVYVLLEATVGGGIPVIEPLKQSLCANRIQSIMGIINGTTNYILTRMQQEGADFDAVLQEAQKLGYAEADPTAMWTVAMRRIRFRSWRLWPMADGSIGRRFTVKAFDRSPPPKLAMPKSSAM
jgi:homoserine dehydrogenase